MDRNLDTMTRPLNTTDLTNIRADLAIREAFGASKDPSDTSNIDLGLATAKPIPAPVPYFNRETRRYAAKHNISLEQAFKRITRRTKK